MDSNNKTDSRNSGNWNSGNWNSGDGNSGDWNSGNWNSGDRNSGDRNSGYRNSGDWNSGYGSSGDRNSGDWNSGYGNSGDWNSGDWNSGDWNSGYRNSGYRNSGYRNSGDWNSGDWNSGYGNSCNRSAGIFCTQDPQVISFDQPTDKKWQEIEHPNFYEFYLNKWISDFDMTEQEKIDNPNFYACKGYLKTYSWQEAWSNYWRDTSEEDRQRVLNLPNFDADKFKDITGIDVYQNTTPQQKKIKEIRERMERDAKLLRELEEEQ